MLKFNKKSLIDLYKHDIGLSVEPPDFDSTNIDELCLIAVNKIKIYKLINQTTLKIPEEYSEKWYEELFLSIYKENLGFYGDLIKNPNDGTSPDQVRYRQLDHLSLLVAMKAFSENHESINWLINMEVKYFKTKYFRMSQTEKQKFIEMVNLDLEVIDDYEKQKLQKFLMLFDDFQEHNKLIFKEKIFYKTKTKYAVELFENHEAILQNNYVYFSEKYYWSPIANFYRIHLSKQMNDNYENSVLKLNKNHINWQLQAVIEKIQAERKVSYYSERGYNYTVKEIYNKAVPNYPPCMRRLHEKLVRRGQIKFNGRRQYHLFLKGMGVGVEECIQLMRQNFLKNMPEYTFIKKYLYYIQHDYGLVGSRIDYKPFSCTDILNMSGDENDDHGCPFKVESESIIRSQLNNDNLPEVDIEDIMNDVGKKKCQTACSKYFKCKYGQDIEVNHPNQYFNQTMKLDHETILSTELVKEVSHVLNEMIDSIVTTTSLQSLDLQIDNSLTIPKSNIKNIPKINIEKSDETSQTVQSYLEDLPDDWILDEFEIPDTEEIPKPKVVITPKTIKEAFPPCTTRTMEKMQNSYNPDDTTEIPKPKVVITPKIIKEAFPPCMTRTMEKMRDNYNPDATAIRSYILFLKRAGFDKSTVYKHLKEDIAPRSISAKKFRTAYNFYIDKIYSGNYNAFQCSTMCEIGKGSKMAGCYFDSCTPQELQRNLTSKEFPINDIEDIMKNKTCLRYHYCCSKYLKTVHEVETTTVFHPNDYYRLVTSKLELESKTNINQ